MGKSVKRQRAKKKRERSVNPTVKYPPPGRREPPLAHQQQSKTTPRTTSKKNSTEKHNSQNDGSIRQLMQRSPVLSSYLMTRQHVLIVGDGDFSFGQALVRLRRQYRREIVQQAGSSNGKNGNAEFVPLGRLTVTGYDSRADVLRKYGTDHANVARSLQMIANEPGASVRHSIDATRLAEQRPQLLQQQLDDDDGCYYYYDLVVFHFPHSGLQRVHVNRNLLYDFFQSVRELFLAQQREQQRLEQSRPPHRRRRLPPPPQVHVTIKNQRPYIHWGLQESARAAGFVGPSNEKAIVPFDVEFWHAYGYRHQTTVGPHEATSRPQLAAYEAEAKLAQTFIFEFVDEELAAEQREENRPTQVWHDGGPAAADVDDDQNDDHRQRPGMDNKKDDENEKAPFRANDRGGDRSGSDDDDDDAVDVDVSTDAMIDDLVRQRDRARRDQNWVEADRLKTLLTTNYHVKLSDHNVRTTPTQQQQQQDDTAVTVVRASSWSWKAKAKPKKKKTTTTKNRQKENKNKKMVASAIVLKKQKEKGLMKITQSKS